MIPSTLRRSALVALLLVGPALADDDAAAPAAANDAQAGQPAPCDSSHVAGGDSMVGAVQESMVASGYTYVRLDIGAEGTWAAIPETPVVAGDCLSLIKPLRMVDFSSPTLGRSFSEIYFATVAETSDDALMTTAHTRGETASTAAAVAPPAAGEIARAAGASGRTVAEVHAQRDALSGQAVAVRGQITKVTEGIMGRTWVHLVDGTGDTADKSDELIVTTESTSAAVGDVVLAEGTVKLDLDLGFGYAYDVLVEDARITK